METINYQDGSHLEIMLRRTKDFVLTVNALAEPVSGISVHSRNIAKLNNKTIKSDFEFYRSLHRTKI